MSRAGILTGRSRWVALLVLPAGKLADAYGRRRMFVAGLLVFSDGLIGGEQDRLDGS